jgi:hypothetical protein
MRYLIDCAMSCFLLAFILLLTLFLSSCATAPKPDRDVELGLVDAKIACYESQTATAKNDEKLTDPKDILLGKAIDALAKAVGKGVDPCAAIITNNDLQKVAMEENTKQLAAGADFAKSAAGNIVVGVGVWKGLDVLPTLFASAGSKVSLSSAGPMTLTDSLKTSSVGDVFGASSLGGILNNPVSTISGAPQL